MSDFFFFFSGFFIAVFSCILFLEQERFASQVLAI